MTDWRKQLREILNRGSGHSPDASLSESRRRIREYFDEVVAPALEALKQELAKHGREAEITRTPTQATLSVYYDGDEEFSYAVQAHAYHRMSFAFPEFPRGDEPRVYQVEITPHERPAERHRMAELTRDDIIQDFLDEYGKWMGW